MIICVPTGVLGLKSEAPEIRYTIVYQSPENIYSSISLVSAVLANEYARGPPLKTTLSYKERATCSLLLVA
jgi:hypothetical protein